MANLKLWLTHSLTDWQHQLLEDAIASKNQHVQHIDHKWCSFRPQWRMMWYRCVFQKHSTGVDPLIQKIWGESCCVFLVYTAPVVQIYALHLHVWGEFWRSRSAHFDNLSGQIINRIAFSNSQHQDLPIVFILVGLWQFDTGWPLKHLARPQTLSMQIARLWGGHWDQHYLIYMLGTIHMHTNIRTNQIDTLHTFNVLVSKGCKYSKKIFSQQNRVNWYLVYFVFRMFHLTFGINIFYIKHISHGVFGIGNFLWFLSLSSGTFPLSAFVKITKETLLAEAVSF